MTNHQSGGRAKIAKLIAGTLILGPLGQVSRLAAEGSLESFVEFAIFLGIALFGVWWWRSLPPWRELWSSKQRRD